MAAGETKTDSFVSGFYGAAQEPATDLHANFDRFIEHLERRRARHEPIVIVIDGRETGVGKSTLAMRICRRMDPAFDLRKITYSAQETLSLYAEPGPWAMVDWDESVLGLLTRKGTRDQELTGIISALSIVRKNEKGTVLTVPKIQMLDTLVYNGLAPIWIFVEARGRARVHRAYKGAQYRKSQPRLAYDLWTAVSPIGFRMLDRDALFRASVEQAIIRNREYFQEQVLISEAKRARLLGLPGPRPESPPKENVPERVPPPRPPMCVCGKCDWTWSPRNGNGGRCPRCGSWERKKRG